MFSGLVQILSSIGSDGIDDADSLLEVAMEDKFQEILNSVTEKPGRSRLEPYGELIGELRRRGLTCRDIAALLAEKCQFQTSKSAVNNFVRARSRRRRKNSSERPATGAASPPPIGIKTPNVCFSQKASEADVRQRIAALKARKAATTPSPDDFHFDPTQPLRLITPEKPELDK